MYTVPVYFGSFLTQLSETGFFFLIWKPGKPEIVIRHECMLFQVHVLFTTSNPLTNIYTAIRPRRDGVLVVLKRPPPIQYYQQNYSGVDCSQQYRSKKSSEYPKKNSGNNLWISYLKSVLFLLWLNTPGTAKHTWLSSLK